MLRPRDHGIIMLYKARTYMPTNNCVFVSLNCLVDSGHHLLWDESKALFTQFHHLPTNVFEGIIAINGEEYNSV
jgi:hypothetical protein